MLYVVVGWTDGFGNDSFVRGIYPNKEQALQHRYIDDTFNEHSDRIAEVEFGEVDIDFYDLPEIKLNKKRKKKRG